MVERDREIEGGERERERADYLDNLLNRPPTE